MITNDGDLAHRLLSPKKHVDKVYFATVEGRLPADYAEQLAAGLVLEDGTRTLPAELTVQREELTFQKEELAVRREGDEGRFDVLLTIREGKFHQGQADVRGHGLPGGLSETGGYGAAETG